MKPLRVCSPVCSMLLLCGLLASCDSDPKPSLADAAPTDARVADITSEAAAGATVTGTITLPAASTGKQWFVRVVSTLGAGAITPVAEASGLTAGGTSLDYTISAVPAGTYYLLGFVDVDASGGTASTPGDHAGWYGHSGDGNPPPAKNVVVPASGTARFDFALVLR